MTDTTIMTTKKRPAETPPGGGDEPKKASKLAPSDARSKYQAPNWRVWQHPFADAALFEFDLRNIQPLIDAAIETTKGHLKLHPKIKVRGMDCHMRRSVGFFADPKDTVGYFFSHQLFASRMPSAAMRRLITLVSELLGSEVNGVLVNKYADGKEYISPHADDESGIGQAGVFCISVGAERRLDFSSKDKEENIKITIPTVAYHAILMQGPDFQSRMLHGIRMQSSITEERVSLTFRKHTKAADAEKYKRLLGRNGIIN